MKASDFNYHLPEALIARFPLPVRSQSRLMVVDRSSGRITHRQFSDVLDYLTPKDLLAFNNSRVMSARLFGHKETGGQVEILIERVIDNHTVLAHVRASKSPKPGAMIHIAEGVSFTMVQREGELFKLSTAKSVWDVMERHGHMPLPHYMQREDNELDRERYQTVYCNSLGSVAAPTAGLHFDEQLFAKIKDRGIDSSYVTLHVGAGTFQPVRTENIADHIMHREYLEVSEAVCEKVRATKQRGGRVVAVGTTSVRCLETAAQQGEIAPYQGDTQIFIYPGYSFKVVDALITNFHLPQSTLLMLVSALAGKALIFEAYETAIKEQYRFFSYGDAMLIV